MTAVLGGDRDEVLAALETHGLTAANDNGPGQIVAAGTMEQLAGARRRPARRRRRLIPLSVAGAFHTEHMAPAVGHLATLARSVSTHDPRTPLISNRDGQVVHDGREVLARIVGQIASPVRWDLCMDTMTDLGVTGAPRDAAGGHPGRHRQARDARASRRSRSRRPTSSTTPARSAPSTARRSMIETTPTWLMVVSPIKGTFHRSAEAAEADMLPPGATVGEVASSRDRTDVRAAHGGQVVEWLVEDGDLVSPGQPLRPPPPGGSSLMAAIETATGSPYAADPGHRQLPPVAGRAQRRHRRRASTPATSGSSSAPASSSAASPPPRRPCR